MAKHRKATMSSRLDRRRSARSRCRSRGAGASLRCAAARPKKGQAEEPYRRRGPPAGRTNRSQPTRHIPGHPRWPFSCTAVWPHRRIVSRDIDLRARRWQRCLLALSSEAGVPQLVIASSGRVDPARERQRAVTSSMPWCGSISSREARRRPSDPFAATLAEIVQAFR